MTGAVLGNSVYVVGGRCTTVGVCDAFQGTTDNQKLLCLNVPTNILTSGGSTIVSAGGNGVLDPGETVTVALGVQNSGGPGVVCTTAATDRDAAGHRWRNQSLWSADLRHALLAASPDLPQFHLHG